MSKVIVLEDLLVANQGAVVPETEASEDEILSEIAAEVDKFNQEQIESFSKHKA